MGWFSEQIKFREKNDSENVERVFYELSAVVMGKANVFAAVSKNLRTKNAVEEICKYYGAKISDIPNKITDMNEQLEYLLRPSGIMRRRVKLEGEWWKNCVGALLGETKDGNVAALLPNRLNGYHFYDYQTKKTVNVNKKTVKQLQANAVCFYRPLPGEPIGIKELAKFLFGSLSTADVAMVILAPFFASVLGLFAPLVTGIIYNDVIPSGQNLLLFAVTLPLAGIAVSVFLINATRWLIQTKIKTKMDVALKSAVMGKIINLPPKFFQDYSAGELTGRVQALDNLSALLCKALLGAGLTSLFAMIYILQIVAITPSLALPALLIVLAELSITAAIVALQLKVVRKKVMASAKVAGVVFSLFSGIQKIKLSGCENRAFTKWATMYKEQAAATYDLPFLLKIQNALIAAIALAGSMLIYYVATVSHIGVPQYVAFNVAFGMVNGAMLSLSGMAALFSFIQPSLEMAEPILAATPETSVNKKTILSLAGMIELNNISFRYKEDAPLVIDNVSLKIKSGQYIAVVGKTGCGKSTLIRLLLGFETPKTGAVYYDGTDIAKIDLKSLRQNIGVVLQNSTLFAGDIFANITISAPWLTLADAWEAARMAGVDEDIRNMPMGMHTMISEGAGGISGGQKQRLMIARAIAPRPKVLIFDEATSALDNITQKQVSDSLASLKCTRVVIAHRLSTIKQCDRIIVLEQGEIIEDGKYDELVKNAGFFAELIKRQQLGAEAGS